MTSRKYLPRKNGKNVMIETVEARVAWVRECALRYQEGLHDETGCTDLCQMIGAYAFMKTEYLVMKDRAKKAEVEREELAEVLKDLITEAAEVLPDNCEALKIALAAGSKKP